MPTPGSTDQSPSTVATGNDSSSAEISAGNERSERMSHGRPLTGCPTGVWQRGLWSWVRGVCCFAASGGSTAYYEHNLLRQYSSSKVSWIPSLQIFFMFAMGPIAGQIYDRFGPRYLLLGGSLLHVFGLMMTSISNRYYQILVSQAYVVPLVWLPFSKQHPQLVQQEAWCSIRHCVLRLKHREIVYPIMISKIINILGFPWTMRTCAFIIFFLLRIANLTVRSRLPPNPRKLSMESLMRPFKELKMMLLVASFSILAFGIFVPMNYLVTEAMAKGMGRDLAEYLVAILNAGSLSGRLGAGTFADTIGSYNIFAVVTYIAGILVLALWIPASSNAGTIVFTVLFGFATGATGLLFLFASIGGLTANPIAGTILQHSGGSYTGMKIFSGVLLIVGSTLTIGVRLREKGLKLKVIF
ncbi:hypothetical protein ABOM_001971 [Aspergillus bombycis]|uniref:Monocarboxylate transporter n=1 Tax=Aspergillus bombycis TaxID=109264 RepID=A0A1F8AB08_9EURO|nr:hypothetical protein ABOM_001971 [Aspergillus bombycis]OGM48615.1 hypothetical protein ABOM_001971 [Aspergillus bombycis]